ncbi:MAG: hypothetical protein AB3N07_02380 [Ruegeria sp.]|uniref:hypothetical protein n=1 Tax=Ruegeria sp. ANG-S4 TaxID=1577904 RepID=UPI00057E5B07|nr:hypothetical protein [Ruegeria sp. ANG-S4]KIC45281.1 hypothetical protein RA28_12525 [Ruegeria sp. ANG-S4]
MPSRDNHVMMTLKLDRWAQDHTLRGFEIERELAAARTQPRSQTRKRARRFSLGNLKLLWTSWA